MSVNSPAHVCVLRIDPSLQACNLNVTAADLLFGTFELEIFFCRLSVCERYPWFGEQVMIGMLKDLKLREVAIFDNFCVCKRRARRTLKRRQGIVALNCITNCNAATSECLRDVFAQFIPYDKN